MSRSYPPRDTLRKSRVMTIEISLKTCYKLPLNEKNDIQRLTEGLMFASVVHKNQKRKYNGEPYINHCIEVSAILQQAAHVDIEMTLAALLHDTVEDCDVSLDEIKQRFGENVAQLVSDLTDVSKSTDGNRENRTQKNLEHSAKTSYRAKTVKLADIISNVRNVVKLSPSFARIYLPEKNRLLQVLSDSDPTLYQLALKTVKIAEEELKNLQ